MKKNIFLLISLLFILSFISAINYPEPFMEDDSLEVAIIYGSVPGVSSLELIQAGNIQTDIQDKSDTEDELLVRDSKVDTVSDTNLIVLGSLSDGYSNYVIEDVLDMDYEEAEDYFNLEEGRWIIVVVESPFDASKRVLLIIGYDVADLVNGVTYLRNQKVSTSLGSEYLGTSSNSAELVIRDGSVPEDEPEEDFDCDELIDDIKDLEEYIEDLQDNYQNYSCSKFEYELGRLDDDLDDLDEDCEDFDCDDCESDLDEISDDLDELEDFYDDFCNGEDEENSLDWNENEGYYPMPFISKTSTDVAVIYGSVPGVSSLELIQAGNIQANLENKVHEGEIYLKKDSELDSFSDKNLIVIGSLYEGCSSYVIEEVLEKDCEELEDYFDIEDGKWVIVTVDNPFESDKIVTLVIGYDVTDLVNGVTYLRSNEIKTSVGSEYLGTSSTSAQFIEREDDSSDEENEEEESNESQESTNEELEENIEDYENNSENGNLIELCSGCSSEGKCFSIGFRRNNTFCSENLSFVEQKIEDSSCINDFECESNVCVSNKCISASLLNKLINWLRELFS